MSDLYHEMKIALDYFGVRFHEMDQISVALDDSALVFTCGRRQLRVAWQRQSSGTAAN